MTKPVQFNNNNSALTHSDFVSEAIQDLLKTNRIIEVNHLPYTVNPLSVTVQNSDKKGLILDLHYVNKHIYKEHVKFEDLRLMEQFLNPHDYMFKFDIKQGYHHIDIHKTHQKFLGLSWEVGRKTCYFVFTVLPFGLTSAWFIFTKVMTCLVKHWRINAIGIACFFDHGLRVASLYKMTLCHSNFMKKSLQNAGFIINEEKSVWKPLQNLIWLGIRRNLKNDFYCNSIVLLIEKLPYATASELGKASGKLISTKFVLGYSAIKNWKFI